MRYAYFAAARRLAIKRAGAVTVHDTLDHRIGGVAQQQSDARTVTFTSQHGLVDVDALPVVAATEEDPVEHGPADRRPAEIASVTAPAASAVAAPEQVMTLIAQLADLHARGVLSDAEFGAKKAELLARL